MRVLDPVLPFTPKMAYSTADKKALLAFDKLISYSNYPWFPLLNIFKELMVDIENKDLKLDINMTYLCGSRRNRSRILKGNKE